MITFETQKINNNLNNIKIPHPRVQNRTRLNQQADTFTPSFTGEKHKLNGFLRNLFTPTSPELLKDLELLNSPEILQYKI